MAKSINFDTDVVQFAFGVKDTEEAFTHDLGRVPEDGFVIERRGNAGEIYRGPTAWTSTTIYVKCSKTGTWFSLMLI